MTIKNRLIKIAGAGEFIVKNLNKIPGKYRYPGVAAAGVGTYLVGKQSLEDMASGRRSRKAEQAQERASRYMSKMAMSKEAAHMSELFNREQDAIFPMASEKGAVDTRQAMLSGLVANKDKMGKMSASQLKSLFPQGGKELGYRQRSMLSGKDACSAVSKAFKGS